MDNARAAILDAFGLTEDDLTRYEALTGHTAAKRAADREYNEFRAMILKRAERLAGSLD